MGSSDNDGIGEKIYGAVLALTGDVRGLQVEMRGANEHLLSIDRRLEMCSAQIYQHGEALASQAQQISQLAARLDENDAQTRLRRRHCSEQFARLGARLEDTGVHIIEQRAEARTIGSLLKRYGILLALLSAAASIGAAANRCTAQSAAKPRPADMRR